MENEGEGWHAEDTPVLAFVDCADQGSGLTLTGFRRPFSSINVHQMGRHKPEAKILEMKAFRKYHDDNLLVEVSCEPLVSSITSNLLTQLNF